MEETPVTRATRVMYRHVVSFKITTLEAAILSIKLDKALATSLPQLTQPTLRERLLQLKYLLNMKSKFNIGNDQSHSR